MKNALSIDLEDWFCAYNISQEIKRENWHNCEQRIIQNTRRILTLLTQHSTKATFFILGWIAERFPDLIYEIAQQGHEIATHGYSHTLLTETTPEEFESDLTKAILVTQKFTKNEILGFRAPSFTITQKTLWALPILVRKGIRYDSSIFPVGFHPDYGISDSPLHIHKIEPNLIEVPLSCVQIYGKKIPCGGGGYFRIFPYTITRLLLKKCNEQGRPIVFYFHPWEIDPDQPRVDLRLSKRIRHYYNLGKTFIKLQRLLNDFSFFTIREVLNL